MSDSGFDSSGDTDFESMVERYSRIIASAVRRVCARDHEALVPDVQQEVYLALWKRLNAGGKKIQHPTSYVYKVALTTGLAMVRKSTRQGGYGDADVVAVEDEELKSSHDALSMERERILEEVLEQLDKHHSDALRAYLAGFDHKEIARLFGWTPSVARHNVYRGMERLKARVAAEQDALQGGMLETAE